MISNKDITFNDEDLPKSVFESVKNSIKSSIEQDQRSRKKHSIDNKLQDNESKK